MRATICAALLGVAIVGTLGGGCSGGGGTPAYTARELPHLLVAATQSVLPDESGPLTPRAFESEAGLPDNIARYRSQVRGAGFERGLHKVWRDGADRATALLFRDEAGAEAAIEAYRDFLRNLVAEERGDQYEVTAETVDGLGDEGWLSRVVHLETGRVEGVSYVWRRGALVLQLEAGCPDSGLHQRCSHDDLQHVFTWAKAIDRSADR